MWYIILVLVCMTFYLLSLFEIKNLNRISLFMMLSILIAFVGFRYGVLWDYFNYETIFGFMNNWTDILNPALHLEFGFKVLNVMANRIGLNWYMFVFLMALVTLLLTFRFVNKYSKNKIASMFLHLSPYMFINDMGAMRNGLSNAIVLNAFKSIEEKELFRFLIFIVLAASFHKSALIFLLAYIICNYFSFSAKKIKFMSFAMLPILFLNQTVDISGIAINLIYKLNISVINSYVDTYMGSRFFYNNGVSVNLVVQIMMLIFVAYTFEKFNKDEDDKQNVAMLNIYFIGMATSVIFSNFDLVVGRFALLFLNFDKVVIVNAIYKYKKNRILLLILLMLYCVFRIYIYLRVHPAAHPYKSILF